MLQQAEYVASLAIKALDGDEDAAEELGDVDETCRDLALYVNDLVSIIREIQNGIADDDCWADDWCPVCHEHPSHDHGGKNCPLKRL